MLVIISIVSIGLIEIFAATIQKAQFKQTVAKMEAIQKALYEYRLAFNRLPCPGDATIAINAANFGMEAGSLVNSAWVPTYGDCFSTGTVRANFTYNTSNITNTSPPLAAQYPVEGMVPTKTLGLPDDYAFDGWGRRFMYAVSKDMTQNGAFSAVLASDSLKRMTVNTVTQPPPTISNKSTQAAEVLISFGPNGHGAYPRNGGTARVSVGSSNAYEWDNCDCDSNAGAKGLDGVFVQIDPANPFNGFDDLVYFSTRGDYLRPANIMAQPFTTDAGGGSQLNGNGMCRGGGMPSCKVTNGIKTCQCPF